MVCPLIRRKSTHKMGFTSPTDRKGKVRQIWVVISKKKEIEVRFKFKTDKRDMRSLNLVNGHIHKRDLHLPIGPFASVCLFGCAIGSLPSDWCCTDRADTVISEIYLPISLSHYFCLKEAMEQGDVSLLRLGSIALQMGDHFGQGSGREVQTD